MWIAQFLLVSVSKEEHDYLTRAFENIATTQTGQPCTTVDIEQFVKSCGERIAFIHLQFRYSRSQYKSICVYILVQHVFYISCSKNLENCIRKTQTWQRFRCWKIFVCYECFNQRNYGRTIKLFVQQMISDHHCSSISYNWCK